MLLLCVLHPGEAKIFTSQKNYFPVEWRGVGTARGNHRWNTLEVWEKALENERGSLRPTHFSAVAGTDRNMKSAASQGLESVVLPRIVMFPGQGTNHLWYRFNKGMQIVRQKS